MLVFPASSCFFKKSISWALAIQGILKIPWLLDNSTMWIHAAWMCIKYQRLVAATLGVNRRVIHPPPNSIRRRDACLKHNP